MKRIEEASLDAAIQIILDPKVFPDDGEFQTVSGYFKEEVSKIGEIARSDDVEFAFDREQIREMLVTILIGYPHNCTAYIAKKYGFDVSELDLATEA